MLQMSDGREFHAIGPANENARSPNLVRINGTVYKRVPVDKRSPCRWDDAAVVRTMSLM